MTVNHAVQVFESAGFHNAAQRLTLLELAYVADRRGVVRYGQSEIAGRAGLSRTTVARWFAFFEEQGIITRLGHGRYRLNIDAFAKQEAGDGGIESLLDVTPGVEAREGADQELARIKALRKPDQSIRYTEDGWPVLCDEAGNLVGV